MSIADSLGLAEARAALLAADPPVVVVDTSFLFNEAVARLFGDSTRPPGAGNLGGLPWYAPTCVANELVWTYRRVASRRHVDPDALLRVLNDTYMPAIRFVDLGVAAGVDDVRVADVARMDRDDVDQARLAVWLAPAQLWSPDKHLRHPGLAPRDRESLELVITASAKVSEGELVVLAGLNLTRASGAGAMYVARRLAGHLDVPGWLVGVAGLGVAALFVHWICASPERRKRLGELVYVGAEILAEKFAEGEQARRYMRASSIAPMESPTQGARVARVLALSPTPLVATEIHDRLASRDDDVPTLTELRALLRDDPAFVQVERYRWQLGERLTFS